MMTRSLDIALSLLAIAILAPALMLVIIVLRLTGEGEVFYVQQRTGIGGHSFDLYKFATMLKDSPNIGSGEITVKNDPRVLPFGKFLRKSKLNEIPQLWNILKGDMSIVGPRPMVVDTYLLYPKPIRKKLDKVPPGLTGIGSIVFRDEERYLEDRSDPMAFYRDNIIPYKSELELWFTENNTLKTYIKIIAVTAWVVVFPSTSIVERAFSGIPKLPNTLERESIT